MRLHRVGIRVCCLILAASAVALAACVGQPTVQRSTPTPTLIPAPSPLSGFLDPLPTSCHQTPPPESQTIAQFDGFPGPFAAKGGGPAWLTSDLSNTHLEELGFQALPETKMLWAIGPNNAQPVTITGHDLMSGTPMWIEVFDVSPPAMTATLPAGTGNRGSGVTPDGNHWEIWGTGLIFLKAGCYQMTARWSGGQWQTAFAVGR